MANEKMTAATGATDEQRTNFMAAVYRRTGTLRNEVIQFPIMKAPASPRDVVSPGRPGPDPELIAAFGRAVRCNFARQVVREEAEAAARRQRILPIVRQAVERARNESACRRAWLFGSYAWGRPGDSSDVDILAEECPDPFLLASIVGRACSLDVHVVVAKDAPVSLRDRVMAEGLPL